MTGPNPAAYDAAARDAAERALMRSFLPLHKRAFGTATGLVASLLVFGVTAAAVVRPSRDVPLGLLAYYFPGYDVSWKGAVIGAAWAGFSGFVMGWFLAFARNTLVGLLLIYIRTKAEMAQTRDLLDHI
jgi:hypothetical protein